MPRRSSSEKLAANHLARISRYRTERPFSRFVPLEKRESTVCSAKEWSEGRTKRLANSTTRFTNASTAAGAEVKEDDYGSRCTSRAGLSSLSATKRECR